MVRIKNIALMSAAGSGKTHELTKRFLYLFLHKNTYPLESLFAITFTRAAAFEMKSRIINYLDVLAKGNSVKYEEGTRESDILNFFTSIYPEPELRRIAAERRNYLLNNLSSLNVSTFHSLFATFLSVIPFEAGILPDYDIVEEEELLLEQAVDKYLDLAYSNSISAKAVLEIIAFEEKSVKNLLVGSFKEYKPWLSYFIELNNRKEQLLQESKRHKEELLVRLREYRNFVKENIEATYTKKGTINNYWSKFLEKIEDFISVQDFDTLAEIIPYFITEDGMRQNYFSDFEKHIDNLARYRETILKIRESMVFFLEALSNKEMIIKFQPLLEIHRIFQEEKKKQNVITFSDIEDYILSVLKENLELNYLYFKLGADIKHLMIDEFQDTSYKQIDILIPVIEEITAYNPEEKSLYYVGDPHQAIFRWRQGAPELFDELKEMYKGKISGEKLDKNYRSKEEIIKFVNKILDKDDKADPQNKGGWLRIEEVGEYFADEGREICINRTAEIVKELKHCGYKESEIAILTRKNDFAAEVGTVLSKSGIPCLSMAEASIMDEPDIHFIIHLLKFLDDPENDFSLFHILTSDVFNLSEEVIRSIKMKRKPLYLTLRSHHPDWEVTKKLNELISLVYFMNPYQLVFHICKYLDLQISYPLASLLDAAITYIGEGCGSLSDFINWVEQYGANIKIKETQFEGVRVMTIHKAKGLEFEIVIIPETNWSPGPESELIFSYSKKAKPEKIFLRKYGKFLPGLIEKEKELCLVDEFNVLYVALTRARSGVWMLGYKRKKGNSGLWFETIKEKLGDSPLPYDRIPKKEASKMVKERGEKVHKVSSEKVSVVKEERELYSPTERGIEIIEPARRAGMKFGDLVHKVLSRVEWLDNLKIDDFADELLRYVKNNFVRTKDEREEVDKRLKPLLLEIFNDQDLRFIFYKDNRNIEYKNELPIYFEDGKKDVSVHIDRVLIEPDRIIIIDFKTGKEKAEYVHQMNVYKKGVELIYPGQKVNTILVYLENQAGNRIKSI